MSASLCKRTKSLQDAQDLQDKTILNILCNPDLIFFSRENILHIATHI